MREGATVERIKVGHKERHGKGHEIDYNVGEVAVVIRDYSWKWMKVEASGEAKYVRCEDYQEV